MFLNDCESAISNLSVIPITNKLTCSVPVSFRGAVTPDILYIIKEIVINKKFNFLSKESECYIEIENIPFSQLTKANLT